MKKWHLQVLPNKKDYVLAEILIEDKLLKDEVMIDELHGYIQIH